MSMGRIALLIAFLALSACQDVIDVDVPRESPRLTLDAVIRIGDTTGTMTVSVRATLSSSFFESVQAAPLDALSITNETTGSTLVLERSDTEGDLYSAEWDTAQLLEGSLRLDASYNGQAYTARTRYVPSVPIDLLVQGEGDLFTGEETEIVLAYTDTADRVDFYLFDFGFREYLVSEDTFYDGSTFEFSYFYDAEIDPGTELNVQLLGVDKAFHDYMAQLIVQSGGEQGPFQTPAATVRGNIVNTTNAENFALGYFAVCQTFQESLTIE